MNGGGSGGIRSHRVFGTHKLHLLCVERIKVDAGRQIDELVRRIVERRVADPLQDANQDAGELEIEPLHTLCERVRGLHCRFILCNGGATDSK